MGTKSSTSITDNDYRIKPCITNEFCQSRDSEKIGEDCCGPGKRLVMEHPVKHRGKKEFPSGVRKDFYRHNLLRLTIKSNPHKCLTSMSLCCLISNDTNGGEKSDFCFRVQWPVKPAGFKSPLPIFLCAEVDLSAWNSVFRKRLLLPL